MTKIHEYAVRSFSEHLNSIDQHIQFTSEEEKNGTIPFLDTCLHVNQDGSTKVTVYRKPTHTDQYLNLHSNHHLQHKRAVVNTLLLRAKTLVSEEDDRVHEIQHVKQAFFFNENYLYLPLQNKTYTNYNTVCIYLLILYTDVTYKLHLQLHTITIYLYNLQSS